jgi:hypothetical protein
VPAIDAIGPTRTIFAVVVATAISLKADQLRLDACQQLERRTRQPFVFDGKPYRVVRINWGNSD